MERTCSCPGNAECPLDGHCLERDLFYSAELTSNLPNYASKVYKGICSTTWKERFGNHNKSFNHERYKTESELSKEVWRIKQNGGNYSIKWSKERTYPSYNPEIGKCSLCDQEKLAIAMYEGNNLLNTRNEIISRCRHRFKYKLSNLVF